MMCSTFISELCSIFRENNDTQLGLIFQTDTVSLSRSHLLHINFDKVRSDTFGNCSRGGKCHSMKLHKATPDLLKPQHNRVGVPESEFSTHPERRSKCSHMNVASHSPC